MKKIFGLLILCLSFSATISPGLSSDNPDEKINKFYQRVWSPYCRGNSLLECPSSQAEELRETLKSRYRAGQSMEDLEAFLKAKYGDQVRMEPPQTLRGSLAYFIPWVAFVIVLIFLGIYWRKRIKPTQNVEMATSSANEESKSFSAIEKQIQDELEERLS